MCTLPGRQKGTHSMRLAVARREADSLRGCKRQDCLELCWQFLQKRDVGQKGYTNISTVATIGEGRKRRGRPPGKKHKPASSEGLTKPLSQSQSVQVQAKSEASSSLLQTSSSLPDSNVLQLPPSTKDRSCRWQLPGLEWLNSFKLTQTSTPDNQLGAGSRNKSPGLLQVVPSAGV